MANIRNLKRELASHIRDQAKISKQIEIDTLKENLEFIPIIIAKENNLLAILCGKRKSDLKKIFSDVIQSADFYNLVRITVDALNKENSEIILNNYAANDVYTDNSTSNYGKTDETNY